MKNTTRKNKVRIFEDLKQSLQDALAYEQGRKSALRVTELPPKKSAARRSKTEFAADLRR